jgi:hypothetical protein
MKSWRRIIHIRERNNKENFSVILKNFYYLTELQGVINLTCIYLLSPLRALPRLTCTGGRMH